ncbi:ATP12 family chaperone protein [Pelagibacterium montanilacus]|uniref:ATP12 family chaperone protein n=1 Tax=Pelagibacterium montanilacus TaxID=2185280 RepID=UPI000F8F0DBC|nr:ATP12 family protein [Pelagibacterium montanilacus]
MREFLEEALDHRDDGYGRSQKQQRRELPKRFYTEVAVASAEGGHTVTLDGRTIKTPTKRSVVVPSRILAERMSAEWSAQGTHIDPETMPHIKLINSAVEGGEPARVPLIDEVLKFCANDLLLYRADTPRELVERQEKVWDDVLIRLARHHGVSFAPTVGVMHRDQPSDTLARLRARLDPLDFITATAMVSITGIMGSGLLAMAHYDRLIDRDAAWTAAHVDEDYQMSLWGEDYEAAARRARRRIDFDAAVNVIEWLRDPEV